MLVSFVRLPADKRNLPFPASGSWASTVCSARRSKSIRVSRTRNTTAAFGGYFAGSYLASFKNRQDAVVLTTYKEDVGYKQVSQLLRSAGLPPASEADYKTALHYSFSVVAAYALKPPSTLSGANDKARTAYTVAAKPGSVEGMHLVGFTRAISDGAFTAQITDLVVHPLWQRRGIGRRIALHLCRQSNAKGADGCIVFVKQSERMFFWRCGFRWSGKYRVMQPCDV